MAETSAYSWPVIPGLWRQLKDFCGFGGAATYLWTRWLLLSRHIPRQQTQRIPHPAPFC